ncbi:nucleoside-diphosphate kinase [Acidimicrobiia bacterium]|jgi:nucleoside-diphosphate kinase|nr:nucleoside-diphosphate kinase [Acidimicrobiia bacterium]MDA9645734.1 nucleoside-diphosphate kinase [Candidatus Actinomarina sp.]|tara:strand:- start:1051 stop:1446 length:396 start_codon:yes stop_codon:yes gene_type:complete
MKTFFMIKPDGVKRNIIGDVVNRAEKEGFVITKMKMMQISTELAEMHYAEHSEKPFFNDLVTFITSGPVVAMEVEGDNAVLAIRELMGATNPTDAEPGTIRGDLASKLEENVVHGSDSEESAARELGLFFN